jgi:UrcA family protein
MKTLNSIALGAAALAASFACAVPAVAAPEEVVTRTMTVSYADLDLTSSAGASTLYSRLKAASRTVCDDRVDSTISSGLERLRCTRATLDRAVKDVNVPTLTALHTGGASTGLTAQR